MANVSLNITARNEASPVLAKVSADLDKVGASVAKAKTGLGSLGGGFEALTGAAFGAGAALTAITAGLAGLGAAGAALIKLASSAANFGEQVQNAAARTGLATGAVQELMKVAKDAGLSFDGIAGSVNKMQVALQKTPKVFTALGLDAKTLAASSPEKALEAIAGKINQIGNQSQKTAALVAVFGRGGAASMAPLLESLEEGRQRAAALGAVLSDSQLTGLSQFDAAMDDLGTAWDGLWLQLGSAVGNSPAITEAIEMITFAIVKLSNWVRDHADDFSAFFDAILSGALSAAGGIVQLAQAIPGGQTLVEKMFGSKQKIGEYFRFIDQGIDRITKRAGDRALGILPVGMPKPKTGGGGPGGVDDAAVKAAQKAQEAWQKAAEKGREAWDKFDDDWARRAKDLPGQIMGAFGGTTTKALGVIIAKEQLEAYEQSIKDAQKAWDQFDAAQDAEWADAMSEAIAEASKETVDWSASLADLANQFQALGGVSDTLGKIAGAIASVGAQIQSVSRLKGGFKDLFAGGIGNIFSKVTSGIGIVSAIGGLIGGLFGKGKKEREEVKKLQEQLLSLGGNMTDLQKLADKFGISLGNAFSTKKPKDVQKVIDQITAAMEKQQKVLAGLAQASDALTGIFTKLKPTTEKGAAAQATIFSTVFWATVKERGFSEAIDALSAPFEALSKSLTEKFGPEVTNRLLGAVSVFFDPKIKESISVFSDIQRALEGVSEAGFITKDSFAAFGQTATDAFAQATQGGLNQQSALQAISPLLASIIATANQYGLTIDANTQALIDQAKAAGIAFPTSPIEKAAAAMERVANALEKALGISNDLGDSLNNLPNNIPDFNGPGDRNDGRDTSAAKGFGPRVVGDEGGGLGPRFQTHAGELVMIVPRDQVKKGKKLIYAARGFGQDEDFVDRFNPNRPRPGDRPGGAGGAGTGGTGTGTGTADRPRPIGNGGGSIPTVFIEQQRKNDKKFERVLALLEKEAAKPKQTNQIAVTQNVNAAFDPASVPATRQALTQQVLRDISIGVKAGAGELSRAIDSRIEMKRGRSRAGS